MFLQNIAHKLLFIFTPESRDYKRFSTPMLSDVLLCGCCVLRTYFDIVFSTLGKFCLYI